MPQATKIATCCYCGTRAMLRLSGSVRHELACASCGAPLHALKWLKAPAAAAPAVRNRPPRPARLPDPQVPRQHRYRRGKGPLRRVFEELAEAVEDIFD